MRIATKHCCCKPQYCDVYVVTGDGAPEVVVSPYQILRAQDGAVLSWSLTSDQYAAFCKAHTDGVVLFDGASDCFVHPDARQVSLDPAGWTLEE